MFSVSHCYLLEATATPVGVLVLLLSFLVINDTDKKTYSGSFIPSSALTQTQFKYNIFRLVQANAFEAGAKLGMVPEDQLSILLPSVLHSSMIKASLFY